MNNNSQKEDYLLEPLKLHEKIKVLRERKGLSRSQLCALLPKISNENEIFGEQTLRQIELGSIFRLNNLYKISLILGISLENLLQNTEYENTTVTKKNNRFFDFYYSKSVECDILSNPADKHMTFHLKIKPHSQTIIERSPDDEGIHYRKMVTCLLGEIVCCILDKKITLKYLESISFDSTILHRFENNTDRNSKFMIVLDPKHL